MRASRDALAPLYEIRGSLHDMYTEMDAGRQVDIVYFDFKKAFDLVDNDRLLQKLAKRVYKKAIITIFL